MAKNFSMVSLEALGQFFIILAALLIAETYDLSSLRESYSGQFLIIALVLLFVGIATKYGEIKIGK